MATGAELGKYTSEILVQKWPMYWIVAASSTSQAFIIHSDENEFYFWFEICLRLNGKYIIGYLQKEFINSFFRGLNEYHLQFFSLEFKWFHFFDSPFNGKTFEKTDRQKPQWMHFEKGILSWNVFRVCM